MSVGRREGGKGQGGEERDREKEVGTQQKDRVRCAERERKRGDALRDKDPQQGHFWLAVWTGGGRRREEEKLCRYNWIRIGIEKARTQGVHAFEL